MLSGDVRDRTGHFTDFLPLGIPAARPHPQCDREHRTQKGGSCHFSVKRAVPTRTQGSGLSQRSLDEYFYHIKQDELIGNRLPFGSPFRNLVGIFRCTPDRSRLASTRLLQRRCPCQGPPWRCLTPSPLGKPALYSYKPVWERDYEDGPTFPYVS